MSTVTTNNYLAIRNKENEMLGVVRAGSRSTLAGIGIGISHTMIERLNEAIGHEDWWFDLISEVEFDTYKAFGFYEYNAYESY